MIHIETSFVKEDENCKSSDTDENLGKWENWAKSLYDSVEGYFSQWGADENAFFLHNVNITDKLLADLKLIPVWSNIFSNNYSFGRIPASSASVESEINKIKQRFRNNFGNTARVDEFVDAEINYNQGRALLDFSKMEEASNFHNNIEKSNDAFDKTIEASQEIENWRGKGIISSAPKEVAYENSCPACSNGDFPTGAHICIDCSINVHPFNGCSESIGMEEGYGEKRRCFNCISKSAQIIKRHDGNNNNDKAKPGKYLGKRPQDVQDSITYTQNKPVPIIKNGNNTSLSAVRVEGKSVSLLNTCAFDSIFLIILMAA